MDINTVLIKSSNINKQELLDFIEKYDIEFEDLSSVEGYEVLPIDDEDIECFNISEEISKKFNTITISLFICDSDYAVFHLIDSDINIRIIINKNLAISYDYEKLDQNADLLINYVDDSISKDDIKRIINEEYIFAEDGLSKILDLFHINFNEIVSSNE